MDIVMIEWMDVMSYAGGLMEESDLADIKPSKAWIVGFLVKEDADNFYVAKEFWEDGQFKYLHVIPKKTAIISVKKLQVMPNEPTQGQQPVQQQEQTQQDVPMPPPEPQQPQKKGFFRRS